MKIDLFDEELEAVIDFQEMMLELAKESQEHDEVLNRKVRINYLKQFIKIKVA